MRIYIQHSLATEYRKRRKEEEEEEEILFCLTNKHNKTDVGYLLSKAPKT